MSRYASVIAAILTSQGVGLTLAVVLLGFSGEAAPTLESVAWAAFAGAAGLAGLGFFYLALARGTMGVVAPLGAAIGAGVPVLVAIAGGEQVSLARFAGISLALIAVVLISLPARARTEIEQRERRIDVGELPLVILTGLGFAMFFIGLDRASAAGAMWWPLVVVRAVGFAMALAVFGVLIARATTSGWRSRAASVLGVDRLRASGRTLAGILPLLALTGIGDMGGNTFFVLARGADAFSVAVVLSSLYPVVTTILAAIFLRERLRQAQIAGVVLATVSVPLLR